jgi:hypothetical protein
MSEDVSGSGDAPSGLVLRGEDGSLYFIRDEILEACKAEGVHRERVEEMIDGGTEVSGFALNFGAPSRYQTIGVVSTNVQGSRLGGTYKPTSTIMCPWVGPS